MSTYGRLTWPGRFNGYAGRDRLTRRMADVAEVIGRDTGIPMILTQGSWSGGSLSAGTHAGSGASDWAVWDRDPALRLSAAWRARGFVAWARGIDADGDGRKDDSFAPHVHVLDPDDPGLSPAAKGQVDLYRAGLDGLVGGRPDREPPAYLTAALEIVEAIVTLKLTDIVPGAKDVDGGELTVAQCLARGAYAYAQIIESGNVSQRLRRLEGRVTGNTDARAQHAYNAVISGGVLERRVSRLEASK